MTIQAVYRTYLGKPLNFLKKRIKSCDFEIKIGLSFQQLQILKTDNFDQVLTFYA